MHQITITFTGMDFPAISVVTDHNFPAVSVLKLLAGIFGTICSYWPGFSGRICHYWPEFSGRSFSAMGDCKKFYVQQVNCSGIDSRIFCP
jgi:hypothetical protein